MGSATAPWKLILLRALESNSHIKHSSFFQLATIGVNGKPSNRTVVFRGFEEGNDKFQIFTDSRTRKIFPVQFMYLDLLVCDGIEYFSFVLKKELELWLLLQIEELKNSPFSEICWYFAESWEQFRITGKIDVIDALHPDAIKLQQREKAWSSISQKSRRQYLGPNPGLPYCLPEQPSIELFQDSSSGPVDAFCLLVFDPDQVDYLNLKSEERFSFKASLSLEGEKLWNTERINP